MIRRNSRRMHLPVALKAEADQHSEQELQESNVIPIPYLKSAAEKAFRLFADRHLVHKVEELEKENAALRSAEKLQQTIRYREPYFYQDGDELPMCPKCWQKDAKAVYMGQQESWKGGVRRTCPVCEWSNLDEPPKPAVATANFPRQRIMNLRRSWPIHPHEFEP